MRIYRRSPRYDGYRVRIVPEGVDLSERGESLSSGDCAQWPRGPTTAFFTICRSPCWWVWEWVV